MVRLPYSVIQITLQYKVCGLFLLVKRSNKLLTGAQTACPRGRGYSARADEPSALLFFAGIGNLPQLPRVSCNPRARYLLLWHNVAHLHGAARRDDSSLGNLAPNSAPPVQPRRMASARIPAPGFRAHRNRTGDSANSN